MTWNITLIIKEQERPKEPFPGRSQHHTVPHHWAGLSIYSISDLPLCSVTKSHEVEHNSFPWHELWPRSCPWTSCRPHPDGVSQNKTTLAFVSPLCIWTEWYMYNVWQVKCFTLLFPASSKMPSGCCAFPLKPQLNEQDPINLRGSPILSQSLSLDLCCSQVPWAAPRIHPVVLQVSFLTIQIVNQAPKRNKRKVSVEVQLSVLLD